MSQRDKLLQKLYPGIQTLKFHDADSIMRQFGFILEKAPGGSSSIKYIKQCGDKRVIWNLHSPHNRENNLKRYNIKDMVRALKEAGVLDENFRI